ncbi:uncharacterized protein LOC117894188 [Drosophila subobscura]|uniref:uncharacterized protein LOC117894188 n=1 Tax=Drosophila subobscura TaxID=7241 RepID=UPI00155B157F|nr:uncharacterized protein LOC117894188 [Drosophila subobscura]
MVLPKGMKNVQKVREMQGRPARESKRSGVSTHRAARKEERSRSAPRRRVSWASRVEETDSVRREVRSRSHSRAPKANQNGQQKVREMQGRPARESKRRGVSTPRAAHKEERSRSAPRRRVSWAREVRSRSHSRAPKENQNGQLIAQAILDLNKVASLEEIVAQLMLRLGRNTCAAEIYESTAQTLKKGAEYGFIQMDNGGYCLLPTPITEAETEVDLQARSMIETEEQSVPQTFKPSALSTLSFAAPPPTPRTPRTPRK